AVLLRPLPYPEPVSLVRIGHDQTLNAVTVPELLYWKEHTSAFASSAGYRGAGDRSFTYESHQEWAETMLISADYFRTLGIAPNLGREFNSDEVRQGGPPAAILSNALWRRACGADPAILGRVIRLDDRPFTVIGVASADLWVPERVDVWLP